MVRKSNQIKLETIQRLGQAVQLFQEGTDEFDDAACEHLGLNRTDLKCLNIVHRYQSVSAGEISRQTKLTKGATTSALDRAERAGYLKRVPDPNDRRGVRLELTDKAHRAIDQIWGPFVRNAEKDFAGYTTQELEVVSRFLEEGYKNQLLHADRVRALAKRKS